MRYISKTYIYSVVAFARVSVATSADELPIVNVRLGPPANSQPQVAAEISLLESARKDAENTHMQELERAYQHAVHHVSSTLSDVIASALSHVPESKTKKATSLLETRDGVEVRDDARSQGFAIDVHPLHQPDIAIKAKLDQIEQKRSVDETFTFQQAVNEFAALESIFTNEVLAQLRARADGEGAHTVVGFLQAAKGAALPASADAASGLNVRLSASAQPFPTVEGLALAMQGRRDASEDVVRNRILELELQFFEAANNLLRDALRMRTSSTA